MRSNAKKPVGEKFYLQRSQMMKAANHNDFEAHYISLRKKEGRLYTDEELRHLPNAHKTHPLKKEWDARKESCQRLVAYFLKKRRPLQILEVGCGNGWLCNQLSKIPEASITGIDINETELRQARNVFPTLRFLLCDLQEEMMKERFDAIVFAASFQYFNSAKEILQRCFQQLKKEGEIHVIDTNFYSCAEALKAANRSREYFTTAGFPQMSDYYFHHFFDELKDFNYTVLYNPSTFVNRLFQKASFPWICIKK